MRTHTINDMIITAEILAIGMAEAVHLGGVFLGWPFSRCVFVYAMLLVGAAVGAALLAVTKRRHGAAAEEGRGCLGPEGARRWTEALPWGIFVLLALSQLIFIFTGDTVYTDGDMTVETAESFLAADGIYLVNPMTGLPYQSGMPLRVKILCLPTLYGILSRVSGLAPLLLVRMAVPAVTLISAYIAYGALGRSLFPGDGRKRAGFLAAVSLLFWAEAYMFGMDGFGILYCGWRGVAIRSGVLVPWLFSLCIRRKWCSALLCVLAEACIVWTLYGCGACFVILAGMAGARLLCRAFEGKDRIR